MEITETRNQIIDLIWNYMDKTPTYWCLFELDWEIILCERKYLFWWNNLYEKAKIIWHYDITAILKYINSKIEWINLSYDWSEIWTDYELWRSAIPNKPLHLYTDEEDKNLLELLQKLC